MNIALIIVAAGVTALKGANIGIQITLNKAAAGRVGHPIGFACSSILLIPYFSSLNHLQ